VSAPASIGSAPSGRRPFRVLLPALALVVAAVVVLGTYVLLNAACACTPLPPTTPPIPPSPVVGVVIRIDSPSLGVVSEFDLLTPDGQTVTLEMGVLENAQQFSLSHLATHEATGVPVRAYYRLQAGRPFVYRLEDAVPSLAPS
jgi:heme A synthase